MAEWQVIMLGRHTLYMHWVIRM